MAIQIPCNRLPSIPQPSTLNLPGGLQISSVHKNINRIPTVCDNTLSLMQAVQPALAPLKPFFDILDTVIALFNCFKAIPKSLATLNPKPIFDCIPEVAEKIANLLRLIPQLSIPLTVISIIDNVLALAQCMIDTLSNIITETETMLARIERAAEIDDDNLTAILDCSSSDLATMQQNTVEALGAIGTLVGVVNIFMSLIGGPEIPLDLSEGMKTGGLDEVIQKIQDVINLVQGIRDKVPIP